MSEMLAPYNTVSRVGRIVTEIGGRRTAGKKREAKYVSIHASTGIAGSKNWLVSGIRRPRMNRKGIVSFNAKGSSMIYSQKAAPAA
jgi:hypothetical protein